MCLLIADDPGGACATSPSVVGITERAVGQIVNDLEQAGYVSNPASDVATATKCTASCRSATRRTATTRSAS